MIRSPKVKTIKKLFALSGNQCAFPTCSRPLVNMDSGKVTGKICHIKGRNVNGPRFDINQTDEERHSYENLILLCPEHHEIIDDSSSKYTTDVLYKMKNEHESTVQKVSEPSDSIVNQFLLQLEIKDGSMIFSNRQKGGQLAHTIINKLREGKQIDFKVINKVVQHIMK